jgi:hypothetical protein
MNRVRNIDVSVFQEIFRGAFDAGLLYTCDIILYKCDVLLLYVP